MKKKALVGVVLIFIALILFGCGSNGTSGTGQESDDVIVLKFASICPLENPIAKGEQYFIDLVEERTDGKVKIEYYPNMQLGSDKQTVQALMAGTIDFTSTSTGNFSDFSKALDFLGLPGLVTDPNHYRAILDNEEIRAEIVDKVKNETNLIVTRLDNSGGMPRGFVYKGDEVRLPEDIKGMKLRTTGAKVEVALFNALGIEAQVIDYSEVYSSIQQNMVHGTYLQPNWTVESKLHEVCDYYIYTMQSWETMIQLMGQHTVDKLGPELTEIVLECALESEKYTDGLWDDYNAEVRAEMEKHLTIIDLTDEELKQWTEASKQIWDQFIGDNVEQEFIEKVLAVSY